MKNNRNIIECCHQGAPHTGKRALAFRTSVTLVSLLVENSVSCYMCFPAADHITLCFLITSLSICLSPAPKSIMESSSKPKFDGNITYVRCNWWSRFVLISSYVKLTVTYNSMTQCHLLRSCGLAVIL